MVPSQATNGATSEALINEAIALLWGGEPERVEEIVDPDYLDHAASGLERGARSFELDRRALREAFADAEVTPQEVIVTGDLAVARVRFRGLHVGPWAQLEPSGRSLAWEEIHIWRVRNGRLIEHWACRDDLAALCRVGAVIRWGERA